MKGRKEREPGLGKALPRVAGRVVGITLAVSIAAGIYSPVAAGETPSEWVPGRVLVQPRAGLSPAQLGRILGSHGGKALGKVRGLDVHVVKVAAGAEDKVARALAQNPQIRAAEMDRIVSPDALPNDPSLGSEWFISKIQAPAAWDTSLGDGVVVAVLDTGTNVNHPDLVGKTVAGWNAYGNNSDTTDVYGHGTWVAGVVGAATNNGTGIAGVGWNAKVMPVRISDASGYATWSTIASALTWAADHGAKVANISFNNLNGSSTIQTAARYFRGKGGVVVVSAGNSGGLEGLPETPELITVSATDSNDGRASFSSYGNYVDLSAPGTYILTTDRGGGYATVQGTSFSSPVVAAVAALMAAANPGLAPAQLEQLLEQSADDLGAPGWDPYFGMGRINASRAVQAAVQAVAVDTQAPTVSVTSPAGGAMITGVVPVDVSAWDDVGVTKVELYAGGVLKGTALTQPFAFSWDSTTAPDGAASLTAAAYDAAGNRSTSAAVAVLVDNIADPPDTTAPTVRITNPAEGAKITGSVTISAIASDDVGVSLLQIYLDGASLCVTNRTTLSCSWNSKKTATGLHTLSAAARDAAGNQTFTQIQVNVTRR